MNSKEKVFWDLLLVLVFIGGIFYVHGMNQTLENQGCEAYWSQYTGLDPGNSSVEFKANASVENPYRYREAENFTGNFSDSGVLESESE